jgi:serine/threonine-protein kinase
LDQTIALDPNFALAHATLAECFVEFTYYSTMTSQEAVPLARAAAWKALDLDPALPEAHTILGVVASLYDYDWKEAEREFRAAMARRPVSPPVRWFYAHTYLLSIGRLREAAEELERALQEDPINGPFRFSLAMCHHAAGRVDEAAAEFHEVLKLNQNFLPALVWLTRNYVAQGQLAEALTHAEKVFALIPWNTEAIGGLAGLLMRTGDCARAAEVLAGLGDGEAYGSPIGYANYHFLREDPEQAAPWMEKAIRQRHFLAPLYLRSPLARRLRDGAGWPALAKNMNLSSGTQG